jgi:hypothetical protein
VVFEADALAARTETPDESASGLAPGAAQASDPPSAEARAARGDQPAPSVASPAASSPRGGFSLGSTEAACPVPVLHQMCLHLHLRFLKLLDG